MNTDTTTIQSIPAPADESKCRTWSDGRTWSRTDAPMVSAFDAETLDAVFEEPSLSFLDKKKMSPNHSIESLTAQLASLEVQCAKLRALLDCSTAS